jgi:integrase
MERSLLLFVSSIKSRYTLEEYLYNLKTFLKFTKVKDYDTLANLDSDTIQKFLEDYVLTLRERGLSHSTMRSYLAAVELFLDVNKKIFHKTVLHKMIPAREKGGSDKPYTTEDIQKMLQSTASKRDKVLVHFLASTGARPRSIEDPILTFKNVEDMPLGCKALFLYAGSRDEYWAFLTPEASQALQYYVDERKSRGEVITSESPVFANKYRVKGQKVTHMQFGAAHVKIYLLLKKAGIERVKNGTRFDKAISYGFRKRFNTILKTNNQVNSNIAEKLMGHKNGLDGSYLKPTREQCFNEFVKAIPELTIDDSERNKIKIQNFEQERSEVEKIKLEIETMKRKRLEENRYGPASRYVTYTKNLSDYMGKGDVKGQIISMLFYLFFETRAPEEQKVQIMKRLEQAKEKGEEFDISWFGESTGLSWKNLGVQQ